MLLAVDLGESVIQIIENGVDLLSGGRLDLSKLDVAAFTLIAQILATIILILIVRFKFWKPITAFLETRKEKVTESLKQKEEAEKEANILKEEANKYLNDAKINAKEIITDATSFGKQEKERIITEAYEEIENKKLKEEADLKRQIEESRENIKKEIVDVAYDLANKMVDQQMNEEKNKAIIDEFLKKDSSK